VKYNPDTHNLEGWESLYKLLDGDQNKPNVIKGIDTGKVIERFRPKPGDYTVSQVSE
jgi:hypothetical protein